jgi:hypothetical protein
MRSVSCTAIRLSIPKAEKRQHPLTRGMAPDVRRMAGKLIGFVIGLPRRIRRLPRAIKEGVLAYEASYRRGVEKFGFWWKVFNWSMWLFILTFVSMAVIAFIIYLPQSQFLKSL